MREGTTMQLWTYQPPDFPVDNLPLPLDPTQGRYWKTVARYRQLLPLLRERIGNRQVLWCYTIQPRCPNDIVALVEWEIHAPPDAVVAYLDGWVWEGLVQGTTTDWTGLFIDEPPTQGQESIQALVSVPLPPGCVKRCRLLPPRCAPERTERAEEVKRDSRAADPEFRDSFDLDPD
jgi:hypothetical protein